MSYRRFTVQGGRPPTFEGLGRLLFTRVFTTRPSVFHVSRRRRSVTAGTDTRGGGVQAMGPYTVVPLGEVPHGSRGLTYAEHSSRSALSNDVHSSTPPRNGTCIRDSRGLRHCQSWLPAAGGPSPSPPRSRVRERPPCCPGPRGDPTRLTPFASPLPPPLSLFSSLAATLIRGGNFPGVYLLNSLKAPVILHCSRA